ncbi:MAG: hypothetical protein ACLTCP_04745 [Ruminococcus bicirculans (ex Wegman et al. 2014)]
MNRTADEIFDGEKFNKAGEFDRATKTYDDPTKHKEEDDEDDFLRTLRLCLRRRRKVLARE